MRDATDRMLNELWGELQNGASVADLSHARGMIDAAFVLQGITLIERDGWHSRIQRCPENGEHGGGRGWCAYCGDIAAPEEDEELAVAP